MSWGIRRKTAYRLQYIRRQRISIRDIRSTYFHKRVQGKARANGGTQAHD
jgi:hypothetical protein